MAGHERVRAAAGRVLSGHGAYGGEFARLEEDAVLLARIVLALYPEGEPPVLEQLEGFRQAIGKFRTDLLRTCAEIPDDADVTQWRNAVALLARQLPWEDRE